MINKKHYRINSAESTVKSTDERFFKKKIPSKVCRYKLSSYICSVIKNKEMMKTTILNTAKELKSIKRNSIININGIEFGELYPMLEVTNKHVSYYDVNEQGNKFILPPFIVKTK